MEQEYADSASKIDLHNCKKLNDAALKDLENLFRCEAISSEQYEKVKAILSRKLD